MPVTRKRAPEGALLADDHRQAHASAEIHGKAAGLGEHVVGDDVLTLVVDEVVGSVGAEGFLVGDTQVDERSLRLEPRRREVLERDRHGGSEVEHVDGSATPHLAVDDLAPERVVAPAVLGDGHDVGVAHQQERRGGRVGALDSGDQVCPAGDGLEALEVEPGAFEVGGEDIGARRLAARLLGAVVHASIADELLQELGHFPGGVVHAGTVGGADARPSALWMVD